MSMIWHLLKKDIHRFRWWLVAWFALLGVLWSVVFILKWFIFQWAPSAASLVVPFQTGLLNGASALFLMVFVIKLVQEDPLTGSTAFWLTRPVRRWNLWLAKAGFIFLLLLPLYAVELWSVTPGQFGWLLKIMGLVGVVFFTWIVALHTSRLSTAALVLFLVYLVYFVLQGLLEIPTALGITSHKSCRQFTDIFDQSVSALTVSKQLVEYLAIVIFGTGIIIYHYLSRRAIRAAIMSITALILVAVLGSQWRIVIFPSFTSSVAADMKVDWTQRSPLQDKVDSAKPGDTITIKAGEYPGGLTITKPLTLVGESAENVVICDGGEYGIKVMSDDVTIENISIQRCRFGILVRSHKDERKNLAKIRNVRIRNVQVDNCIFGIYTLKTENLAVEQCKIENTTGDGIWVSWEPENTIINGNRLKNIGDQGIWLGHYPNTPNVYAKNGVISSNIIDNARESGIFFSGENCKITDNLIINVKGDDYSAVTLRGALVKNVEISRNSIHNNAASGIGIKAEKGKCGNIIVKGNNIYRNEKGGIENDTDEPVDARNNWWGAADGPREADKNPQGTGNGISGNVLYDPWENAPLALPENVPEVFKVFSVEKEDGQ